MDDSNASVERVLEILRGASASEDPSRTLRILEQYLEDRAGTSKEVLVENAPLLSERREAFVHREKFEPGELVIWKEHLKNRRKPRYGEPIIVLEPLSEPYYDPEKSSGSPYFREPLDLICGLIDEDSEFVLYHYDSRRFERWQSQT